MPGHLYISRLTHKKQKSRDFPESLIKERSVFDFIAAKLVRSTPFSAAVRGLILHKMLPNDVFEENYFTFILKWVSKEIGNTLN